MRKNPIKLRVVKGYSLEQVIRAVKDLLSYYEDSQSSRFNGMSCPFCPLFRDCEDCLWWVFHHNGCQEWATRRFGEVATGLKWDKKWRVFRIKELKCWLKELKRPGVKVIEWG